MFAPKIAKPQTKVAENLISKLASHRSSFAARRLSSSVVEQALVLQRSVGNQVMLRLLAQQATRLTRNEHHGHNEKEVTATTSPQSVSRQLDPQKVYCALHAAVCLGLSENPPAAALCWANFAAKCGGAMAAADQGMSEQGGSAAA
jgi:hypothetical protein